jgi:phenylalanyl-tRNA synthetase beta chain
VPLLVPTFRPDLAREIDLIEEVGRLIGLDRVPATLPPLRRAARSTADPRPDAARDALVALGFTEAIGFSFGPGDDNPPLRALDGRTTPLRLLNPLGEDRASLRLSVLPGLLRAAERNLARGVSEQRLFEVGTVFLPRDGRSLAAREGWPAHGRDEILPEERRRVAGVLLGRREAHLKDGGPFDFFDGKGALEALLGALRVEGTGWRRPLPGEAPLLHPGRSAVLTVADQPAAVVGEAHTDLRRRMQEVTRVDLGGAVLFEVDLASLGAPAPPRPVEIPRFPGSARDLSFFVGREVPAADIAAVVAGASPLVESVRPLDDYREPGRVPDDKKSVLFSIGYRAADRTLTDEEVGRAHAAVVAALAARFAIEIR